MDKTQLNLDAAIQEVIAFHQQIEIWFNGTATDQSALFTEITSAFSPLFAMRNGDGKIMAYEAFVQWLPTAYGLFPARRIEVDHIRGFATTQHVLVEYIEVQYTNEVKTTRRSSAVFVEEEAVVKWAHLLEQWVV